MTTIKRIAHALAAAGLLFVVGLLVTLDLMWRAVTGKEGL